MSKLQITSIECLDQQEEKGKPGGPYDEIYFKLDDLDGNAATYKSGVMRLLSEEPTARYHEVHPGETYNFTGRVKVEVWERDGGGNKDELLYRATVDQYGNEYNVTDPPGSNYELDYHVV